MALVFPLSPRAHTLKLLADRFDLTRFSASDMVLCGAGIRAAAQDAATLEDAAAAITSFLHAGLWDGPRHRAACALVRFYRTIRHADLEPSLQQRAAELISPLPVVPEMRCLTLLGTAGDEPAWNSRRLSQGHSVIPLQSPEAVRSLPMVARLISQLGMKVEALTTGDPGGELVTGPSVFYVPQAVGSRYVPAQQEFVLPYQIRSVLGFGGTLLSGDLFGVILFARVTIPKPTADLFRYLSADVRAGIVPPQRRGLFAAVPAAS